MLNLISRFVRNDSGAAAVEYGLLVALIAAVVVTVVAALGDQVKAGFCAVENALVTPTGVAAAAGCAAAPAP